jgi:hypothetical protein
LRKTSVGESPAAFATKQRQEVTLNQVEEETVESDFDEGYTILDEPELAECLLLHPEFDNEGRHPLSFPTIAEYQSQEPELTAVALDPGNANIQYKLLGDSQVIVTVEADQRWRICIPDQSLDRFIMWYHVTMGHPGISRLYATIKRHFHHKQLRNRIEQLVGACDTCQRSKSGARQYGELPVRDVRVAPWYEVHVDLIGPWKVSVNGIECAFKALTMIDPVTNLVEIVRSVTETKQRNILPDSSRILGCRDIQGQCELSVTKAQSLKEPLEC